MSSEIFELLDQATGEDAHALLDRLAEQLRQEKNYHQLYQVRLMQARLRVGQPVAAGMLSEMPEPARSQAERLFLDACREVGGLLAEEGKLQEAWNYLQYVGDKEPLAAAFARLEVDEENLDEVVELALQEGVDPAFGYRLVLEHYGTCNAITAFEGTVVQHSIENQKAAAGMLVQHLYDELLESIRAHITDRREKPEEDATLVDLIAGNDWIFENDNYHVDISHLHSTVRIARLLEDPDQIELAWQLTQYGRRLAKQYQMAGEEPFLEAYADHGRFYAALLRRDADEAIEFFRNKAETVDINQHGTAALETYLILLYRLQHYSDALEEYARLVPPDGRLSPYSPTMFELAEKTGSFDRYLELCRERDDVLSYGGGLAAKAR